MARQKQELQREIERHIKKNADQLQYFSNQIQNLKGVATKPFTRIQRPCCKSQNIVREEKVFQKSSIKQPKCVMRDQKVKMINDDFNLDDSNSILSIPSVNTQTTASMSVNKCNLKIDQTPLSCCASRLLQFLFMELKNELKEFVPKDHKIVAKILSEINHTLKRANKLPRMGEGDENNSSSITNMKNQFVQTELGTKEWNSQNTSNTFAQTDLIRDQVEMFIQKASNLDDTLEAHKKLDADFRNLKTQCEKLKTDRVTNCYEEIAKLRNEISSLKKTLKETSDNKDNLFCKKLDDKCIELKDEMRGLHNILEPKKNYDLINNLSETLIKSCEKINSLEVKCAETTKESLIQLFENVKLDFLLNSRKNQTEELSREVENINSAYVKEIETLKSCRFQGDTLSNDFEIQKPKNVLKKCASSLQKKTPIKLIKSNTKQKKESNQYQVDGDDDNDTIDMEFIGDKCEKIFERKIDESTIKSNNDIMEEVMVNDEHHLHSCRNSSKTSSKISSNVKKIEQVLNCDEIKLMSLLESVEYSRLYHNHN